MKKRIIKLGDQVSFYVKKDGWLNLQRGTVIQVIPVKRFFKVYDYIYLVRLDEKIYKIRSHNVVL